MLKPKKPILKTMQDVLECAIYTSQNYKSDIFFSYSGHANSIGLHAYFNGWSRDADGQYFCHWEYMDNLSDNDIDNLATRMIEWIEANRIEKLRLISNGQWDCFI